MKCMPIPHRDVKYNTCNDDPLPFANTDDICPTSTSSPDPIVIPDPYEMYLKSLPPGQRPEVLTVARESHALRSIPMLMNNKENVDAIVDPGSQIIAMSEGICHDLGLPYDPSIRLNMESANKVVDQSLGLCRNVPCSIGNIILYFQIHVIRNAAYDVLLGRPFDVLTQSVIKNFPNEDQTITICDPNSMRSLTIPTIPRGCPRYHAFPESAELGFCED
jgi:hypothetical protein